jgi:putative transcriptional regulator
MPVKHIPKTGQVLLADPFLEDPYFKRAVILLCEHNQQGSIGFILNRNMELPLEEVLQDFPDIHSTINYGGPVETDSLHYVHNVGEILDGSVKVMNGIWWGGDFEKLKFLIRTELVKPENIRFYLGYSGWSTGQLDEELESGSWMVAPMDSNYLFNSEQDNLWNTIMFNKGDHYEIISDIPDFISWN